MKVGIPLFFAGRMKPEPDDDKPIQFTWIHGHCWFDTTHIVTMRVLRKERQTEQTFLCKRCQVREKQKPCKRSCAEELVLA